MDETKIKAAVLTHIRRAMGRRRSAIVTTEFSLGRSGIRADLAVLAETFIGIEIKSAGDTLRRLRAQLDAYAQYFDDVVLIVADRHLRGINREWLNGAALWRVGETGEVTEVTPSLAKIVPHWDKHIDLLTQSELRRFWSKRSEDPDRATAARHAFYDAFVQRYGRTSDEFWSRVAGRKIKEDDLATLSRFSALRERARQHEINRNEFWRRWVEQEESSS